MIKRTGNKKIAVVGWGRGMGHTGHMYLADAVITQAQDMNADPYFFVSKTVGKDDPLYPEEKLKIYQRVFPQQATIFTAQGNLNQALQELAELGYQGVVLVVGADQKQSFQYLERANKEGVPVFQSFGLKKLKVISRQETRSQFASEEGPRATPMREILLHPEATEEQKFKVWRRDMPAKLGDAEVAELMHKAESRLMGTRVKKTNVAESMGTTPNEVAELLYNAKPEIFTKFGDEFVMNAIEQACEQHQGSAQEVAHTVVDILKQGISEAYDHNAPFNAADFNRHMEQLRAREELRKTDPMRALVGDLIDKDNAARNVKKKPQDDDSIGINDPRHPQYAYTQAGHHNIDEDSELPVQQHKSPYEGSDDEHRYTTMFLASPNSAQRFAKHIISNGGKARIGKRGQDYYVYHNMPLSKEEWRKSEQQGVAEDDAGDVEQRMRIKIEREKQRLAQLKKTDPEAYQREMAKREQSRNRMPAVSTFEQQGVDESPEEALKYATKAHAGQTRSGGDPYITHPMRVADHIRQYKQSHNLDALISAAYLHDTIEDTDTTQEVLHDLFGGLVASLVKELTSDPEQIKKMGKAQYLSHKMAVMSSYGLVIKLADRLDNVKDITTAKTPEWRAKYAKETNQILDYIEKTRALSSTHNKLISLIRAKLAEIDNPQQGVAETALQGKDDLVAKRKALQDLEREPGVDQAAIRQRKLDLEKEARAKGLGEEGMSRRGILKGLGAAMAAGAAGKASAIAGAFPTPSHQQAMYKAAADSNAAQARADAAAKAKADAERLKQGTSDIERLNKINYHGGKVTPANASWDGDSDFLDLDGTKYSMASRMPIKGNEPRDMKLISTREGHQVYMWTRNSLKGVVGRYFYPAPADSSQINEFAPGNGDDGLPYAEYQVYQCNPEDQFDWIGGPLYQTDNMGMAHKYAYEKYVKHRPKAFMVWQERSQGSRGNYGVKGQSDGTEDDMTESSDYLDEK